ncbi:general secretion pathway protein GspK [Delftia sp. JD2]|nr:general secretion pathway protein GspK [Delftia sp. JD2]
MMPRVRRREAVARGDQGMALVLVLWIVAALAIFASSLGGVVRQEAAVGGVTRNMAEGRAVGEAAIYLTLQRMATSPTNLKAFESVTVPVAGRIIPVEVIPWSGLVNINNAPPALLALVLSRFSGLGSGQAEAMAQAIVQTREEMRRRSIRVPFEATEDLLQVPGMTYAIYAPLRHFVVADSDGRPGVNLEASPLALRAVLETADVGGIRQAQSSSRYTVIARVPFEAAGAVLVMRQVDVRQQRPMGQLPWTDFSSMQVWQGRM